MLSRRTLFTFSAGAIASQLISRVVTPSLAGNTHIDRLCIIAPASAGGGYDQTARACEAALQAQRLINSLQVTNIPGAGGTVGLMKFLEQYRGKADAVLVSGSTMISAVIANRTPLGLEATTPLARLYNTANAIVVPTSSAFKTLDDLTSSFRKDAAAVAWAGGSIGGGDHLTAGMLMAAIGVDPRRLNYVAFSGGGEMVAALLGGHVAVGSSAWSEISEQVRAGKLRCLGITTETEHKGIPATTLRAQGVDVVFNTWRGLVAAPQISADSRQNLLQIIDSMVRSQVWKAEAERNEWSDAYLAGDAFADVLAQQTKTFRKTLSSLGLA